MRLVEARRASVAAQFNLAVFAAGSEIVIHGFVFPVGDPHSFGDSFGAPRMMGSEYEHAHQGTDIMAPFDTPLLACERGIITEMGTDVLGGTKLWLKGESGTYYYYAHLSAFAEGLQVGDGRGGRRPGRAWSATPATPRAVRRTSTSRSTPTAARR